MSFEYCIIFQKERCIQCHACGIACKSWRSLEPGINWRTVRNIWHGIYPDVSCETSSIACMHCVEPVCLDACQEKAIRKHPLNGIVTVDRDACTGCRQCLDACPYDVPQFGSDGIMQKCDLCVDKIDMEFEYPACVATCPTGALQLLQMDRDAKLRYEGLIRS
jgi:anaerobic dimethyl sulfoxide reductase subunit B (iron-sulfur subunit)